MFKKFRGVNKLHISNLNNIPDITGNETELDSYILAGNIHKNIRFDIQNNLISDLNQIEDKWYDRTYKLIPNIYNSFVNNSNNLYYNKIITNCQELFFSIYNQWYYLKCFCKAFNISSASASLDSSSLIEATISLCSPIPAEFLI